ncbi:hypothetical protein PS843_01809 [Pseudomonas fluorescens]|nr:hypothetical protein PS843_01809 [Pseudomonas fluorescens]
MTVRAQRYSIARTVRTFLGQMLNVVNLKKRTARLFKRSWVATAFAFTFSLLANPRSHFRIANIRLSAGLSLLWFLNPLRLDFNRLLLKLCSSPLQRCLVRCRGKVFGGNRTWSIECFTNALRNIGADILGWLVSLDRYSTQLDHNRRNVLHSKLNRTFGPTGQSTLAQNAIFMSLVDRLTVLLARQHAEIDIDRSLNLYVTPIAVALFRIHTIAEGEIPSDDTEWPLRLSTKIPTQRREDSRRRSYTSPNPSNASTTEKTAQPYATKV